MQALHIEICPNPETAPNYNKDHPEFKSAYLIKAIIVKNGTVNGNSTVDLQFTDSDGNMFIAMSTATIIKSLASALLSTEGFN
jgi:hypothetical protein